MSTPKLNEWEKEVAAYWEANSIFEKSIEQRPADKPYVFYDGPPFATGLPHYGHILAGTMKDLIPRYFTMRGYRVERKWGWDCHGLPVENIIEKELNLGSKKEIEEFGVAKFNEACRSTVLRFTEEWKTVVKRMGRWADMEDSYKTMDKSYMESVWWVFKQLFDAGLIYEGYKAMHVCPRCETPLSNFEVTQGYKDVKDISVYPKFKLSSGTEKFDVEGDVFALAWTTTPWTLPGNLLLAVAAEETYVLVRVEEQNVIVAKELLDEVMGEKPHEVVKEFLGKEMDGMAYEPLFPYFADLPNAFRVVTADFVTMESGTGIVHNAGGYGADDYELSLREDIPMLQHVGMDGKFIPEVTDFAGMSVKTKEDPTATDIEIIKWLAHHDRLFAKKKIEHSYPHCWRCDTPLLNYATSSWFVKVTDLKEQLLTNNTKINWVPEHIKEGRFGKWLEGARDWAVSRNRFWGAPLPIWKSEDGDVICVGSAQELEELTGQKVDDLHKHFVDELTFTKDGKEYRRIGEVLDCWFESGSMPYGQMHYPFENKEKFEAGFPAKFIAEGQDQTRGWFYTLHVLATALTHGDNPAIPHGQTTPAFENVIVNGIILAEDGRKMSKRLKNYPDPMEIVEKYSADALRWYLMNSPVTSGEDIRFSEAEVDETYKKVMLMASNITAFYTMYADKNAGGEVCGTKHPLDFWIMARLHKTVAAVTAGWDGYHLAKGTRALREFIDECSTWYVRRSRDRFKAGDDDAKAAAATLREVVMTLAKMMAPVAPFIAEKMYQQIGGELESVHLEMWPELQDVDETVLEQMNGVRQVVELGLSARADAKQRIRQPLQTIVYSGVTLDEQLSEIVAEELNVKEVVAGEVTEGEDTVVKTYGQFSVGLVTTLTDELKQEAVAREVVRAANAARKKAGFTIDDRGTLQLHTDDEWMRGAIELHKQYVEEGSRCAISWADSTSENDTALEVHGATVHVSVTK